MSGPSICVFAGSGSGSRPEYADAARELGRTMAMRGMELVYGGGRVGLMGTLADAVLAGGGRAVGVIPDFLATEEIAHAGLSELCVVTSMHERKALMAERSRAFLTLPGGLGTLDELFEMMTWTHLGLHAKPCGLLNVSGYFDGLLGFLAHAEAHGFVRPRHGTRLIVEDRAAPLLERLESATIS